MEAFREAGRRRRETHVVVRSGTADLGLRAEQEGPEPVDGDRAVRVL